jgi:tetratricopeptide (TPR) repeat protein
MKKLFTFLFINIALSTAAQNNKINNAMLCCKKGESLMQQNKYDSAFIMFSKAISLNPASKYYCKRGACLMLQNKYDIALANFDSSIVKDNKNPEAYFLKATVFQFTNKTIDAISFYSKAIEVSPNYTDAYLMRGILYATLKKKNQACSDLKKAAQLGSDKAKLHINEICGN